MKTVNLFRSLDSNFMARSRGHLGYAAAMRRLCGGLFGILPVRSGAESPCSLAAIPTIWLPGVRLRLVADTGPEPSPAWAGVRQRSCTLTFRTGMKSLGRRDRRGAHADC